VDHHALAQLVQFLAVGRRPEIDVSLEVLGVGDDVIVVERGDVLRAIIVRRVPQAP